jgi:pimeloyl-ACP methyl ester carboxylesterase
MASHIKVNGVDLWHRITGKGEPVIQIHGSGFGHFNFDPVTPPLGKQFRVIDYDMRGYGQSDRPVQDYTMETWADDVTGLLSALGIERAHIHGTSMGGMIAQVVAGKYPDRVLSVVIGCSAAKMGTAAKLFCKNQIDIVKMDPDGVGSRLLAEFTCWMAVSRRHLAAEGTAAVDNIQRILRESNRPEVFIAACEEMRRMDLRPWLAKITAPALVIGGDEDIMTPWDQGPDGAGQQAVFEGMPHAEKYVIAGGGHSNIFDSTEEYVAAVSDFFSRHGATGGESRAAVAQA